MLSAEDQALVDRDSELIGLRFLLDAECLKPMLADSGANIDLNGLGVGYLRYKPGVNCIARLDLGTGFAYAKAYARDAAVKLAKAGGKAAIDGPGGIGRTCFGKLGIIVNFFPNDGKLPAVGKLADPTQRKNFLERVFKSDPAWSEAGYSALNYKPERRFVARLTREDGRAASIKFYSSKEFRSTRRSRKKFDVPQGVHIPQWIGGSKTHRVMAYSWLPGETLHERFQSGHFADSSLAGEAIAQLHQSAQPALGKRETENETKKLASLSGHLGHLLPELAGQADELGARLTQWVRGRKPRRRTIHGDFYDKQVIVQRQSVGIIDSDRLQLGDPEFDLGCFLAHLERRRIDGVLSATQVASARQALLEGYREAAPEALRPREINRYTAFNLFQLSHHPFRDRRANWGEQTDALLARCSQLIDGGD